MPGSVHHLGLVCRHGCSYSPAGRLLLRRVSGRAWCCRCGGRRDRCRTRLARPARRWWRRCRGGCTDDDGTGGNVELGEIVARLGSWTPDLVPGAEPEQALQMVELAPGGTIYVDDCCEPAYGTTFVVTDSFDPASTLQVSGIGPESSPDGTRLALSSRGSAVAIADAEGNQLGAFGDPDFSGNVLTPLSWVDSSTLVVSASVAAGGNDRLVVLDVNDPNIPAEIIVRSEPGRSYAAADVRADGNVLVVVRRFDPAIGSSDDDVVAEIIDPATGATVAEFDLPNDVYEVNYDAAGRFVLTVRENGEVEWYGAGRRGTLASGFLSADW